MNFLSFSQNRIAKANALACVLATSPLGLASAETPSAPDTEASENAADKKPIIRKIDEDRISLGKITVNKKTQELSFSAQLGDPDNIVEYLAVTEQGKIHETLIITEIKPLNLNIAMLLLNYKPSKDLFRVLDKNYMSTEKFHKEPETVKKASRFNIFVEWQDGDKKISRHVNELIYNSKTKKEAKSKPYVYCGSYLLEGKFKAQLSGDIIAIFTDRGAIANFSNEGREDDTIWFPNKKKLPKKDTPITIVFRKH